MPPPSSFASSCPSPDRSVPVIQALHNLTPCAVEYTSGYVLDMLRPHCLGIDLNARHGALLAVAEVVHALAEHARRHGQHATQHIGTAGPGVDWWRGGGGIRYIGMGSLSTGRLALLGGGGGEELIGHWAQTTGRNFIAGLFSQDFPGYKFCFPGKRFTCYGLVLFA